jgi:hypothetical protein
MTELEIPEGKSLVLIPDHVMEALGGFDFIESLSNAVAGVEWPVIIAGPKELLDQIRMLP